MTFFILLSSKVNISIVSENDLNQFERDAWFHEFSVQCIYQHCNMETERGNYENEGFRLAEISNQPNKFLNAFFSRAFFDIRDSARLLEYLRNGKILIPFLQVC